MTFLTLPIGLYGKLAQQEIERAQNGNTRYSYTKHSSKIIATHVQDSNTYLSFGAMISNPPEDRFRFEQSSLVATRPQLLLLDDTSLDSTAKLDKYVKTVGLYLHEHETSHFMKVTIGMASDLCEERNVSRRDRTETRLMNARSSRISSMTTAKYT